MDHGGVAISELLSDIAWARDVSRESIPPILLRLVAVQTALAPRTAQPDESHTEDCDRLLTAQEAAKKLGVTSDWLYRRSRRLPFAVKLGRAVRFSQSGIDRWIRNKSGR